MSNSVVFEAQEPNGAWDKVALLGGAGQQIVGGENANGALQTFYIGDDQNIYSNWQTSPGGNWHGEARPFAMQAKKIAMASNADGRLALFVIGLDDDLHYFAQQTPNSQQWNVENLANKASTLVVAQNVDGRLEVIFADLNENLFSVWQSVPNGNLTNFVSIAGTAREICIDRNQDGRLEFFYLSSDNGIHHAWQSAPGAGPYSTASFGDLAKTIAVGKNGDGRLEIFYVGTDTKIYHNWQVSPNSSWNGQTEFGGTALSLTLATNPRGALELFYIGVDGYINHQWQTGSGWSALVRNSQAQSITAISRVFDQHAIALFYLGSADPAPQPDFIEFTANPIVMPGANWGGNSTVNFHKNGDCNFISQFYVSAGVDFGGSIVNGWMVVGTDGVAYACVGTFDNTGTVHSMSGNTPQVQSGWTNLVSKYSYARTTTDDGRSEADVITDLAQKLGNVRSIVRLILS